MPKVNGLSAKQQRFCEEYLVDFNSTEAAMRAGYSKKTAYAIGAENLRKPQIQAAIQEQQAKLSDKTGITIEKVINEYSKIAFSDLRKFYNEDGSLKDVTDLEDEEAAAISGIEIETITAGGINIGSLKKIKRWDKKGALDSLCRVLGFNAPEKKELSGPGGRPIQTENKADIDYSKLSEAALKEILNARNPTSQA